MKPSKAQTSHAQTSLQAALFTVYYNTPEKYKLHLRKDCKRLNLSLYETDATGLTQGYAENLNKLIRKQLNSFDVFFLANPDIDLHGISKEDLLVPANHFDIWGYALHQNNKIYYGGELDKWRMSGGLIPSKPHNRFTQRDFVSGSLMAVKQETFKTIGLLDESYFMYYEDVEFCTRARLHTFKVGIDTHQYYNHFESSDTNPNKKKWLAKNRLRFLWQYGTWQQKVYELIRLPKTQLEECFPF